jgi:hypothetical protein
MQEDPNTDQVTRLSLTDTDDWIAAFEPYREDASAALSLAFKLAMLRAYLDAQTIKYRHAIEVLDMALEVLFPHTEFHNGSFDLFIRLVEGRLTFEEGEMLKALGINF